MQTERRGLDYFLVRLGFMGQPPAILRYFGSVKISSCAVIPGCRFKGVGSSSIIKGTYTAEDLRCFTTLGREAAAVLEATRYAERQRQIAAKMRMLYRQVVAAREVERGRLARELHDGVLRDLCAVTRDLKALEAQTETGADITADLTSRAGETVNALRAICNDLRPPLLQHDLVSALNALVASLDARSSAPVHIEIAAENLSLPDDVALTVFRITQKAQHNAIEHADASEIAVQLTQYPDHLRLTVTDDGRGIAGGIDLTRFVADEHFGLAGMRERAAMVSGKLEVQTAVDYGTVVILEIPHPRVGSSSGEKAR